MKVLFTSIVVASGVLAIAGTARAGGVPAWCKGAQLDGEASMDDLATSEPRQIIEALTKATCAPNDELAAHAAQIEKSRQAWGKRLGMTDADWADAVAWVNANEGRDTHLAYSTKDATKFSAVDQYLAITTRFSDTSGSEFRDWVYTADAFESQLTEVGRFGVIQVCLKEFDPTVWMLCQGDIDAFDRAKFDSDLRAAGNGGDQKMEVRLAVFDLKDRLAEHAGKVAALVKEDAAYQQMFDVVAKGRAEWAAGLGKQSALLALVLQMDSAVWSGSRKQHDGCEATTSAALAAAVTKIPTATLKGMGDDRDDPFGGFAKQLGPVISADPELNLAAIAYIECQPNTGTSSVLESSLAFQISYRGPRSMAWVRLMNAGIQLDDTNVELVWPHVMRAYGGDVNASSAGAVIATVAPEGDHLLVTPKALPVKVEVCSQSHTGKHVIAIHGNGTVEYEDICDKFSIETIDHSWAPFKIKTQFAALLKKGVKFSAAYGESGSPADVIAVWSSEKADVPTWLLGAKVK